MKKILFSLIIAAAAMMVKAQDNLVNDVFNKYSGQKGYTTVNITGDFFKMMANASSDDKSMEQLSRSLTEVRILAQEDKNSGEPLNFNKLVYDKLDKSDYKELMTVRQSDENVNMLVKETDGLISEFLLIVSGDDNVLISIRGKIKLSELSKMANSFNMEGFDKLKLVENVNN